MNTDICYYPKCPPSLWVCGHVENAKAEVVEVVEAVHRIMNHHSAST